MPLGTIEMMAMIMRIEMMVMMDDEYGGLNLIKTMTTEIFCTQFAAIPDREIGRSI